MAEAKQLVLVKSKTGLIKTEGKKYPVSGRGFNSKLFFEHLQDHLVTASDKWCSIECMAGTMLGRNSDFNRRAARQRLTRAFNYLLDRGVALVIDRYPITKDHHGEAKAVKIYDPTVGDSAERQVFEEQIKRMRQRKEITEARYQRAFEFLK